jgi:DNA-binding NarL/FixJ family response regulator
MGTHRPSVVIACGDAPRASELVAAVDAVVSLEARVAWPVAAAMLDAAEDGARVLVVDASLRSSDLRALADLTAECPELAVLIVGPVDAPIRVMVVLASGALGYVSTGSSPALVADAVAALVAGETVLPGAVTRPLVEHLRDGGRIVVSGCAGRSVQLTNREWEVLVLLGQGRTTREIATRLVVSAGTVRSHVAALLRKLGARDRLALAATIGIASDLVSPACLARAVTMAR